MKRILGISIVAACAVAGVAVALADQQSSAQPKTTGEFLANGYEVKGVINNEFLVLQKGNKTYFCGAHDTAITWDNWAKKTIDSGCEPLSK
jgi:hypothetical protein